MPKKRSLRRNSKVKTGKTYTKEKLKGTPAIIVEQLDNFIWDPRSYEKDVEKVIFPNTLEVGLDDPNFRSLTIPKGGIKLPPAGDYSYINFGDTIGDSGIGFRAAIDPKVDSLSRMQARDEDNERWTNLLLTRSDQDPVDPPEQVGYRYYNTDLNMLMAWDNDREKWLSVTEHTLLFGRRANTAPGIFLNMIGATAGTNTHGYPLNHNATIVKAAITRTDFDPTRIELIINGTAVTTLLSASVLTLFNNLDVDLKNNRPISAKNSSLFGSNTVSNIIVPVTVKWRAG